MIKVIRCSGLARPMNCAGSLFFKDLPPNLSSDAAKEGTAAGEYLERLLTGQVIGTHAKNGVPFDDDMKFHTTPVMEEIKSNIEGEVLCETRIDWQTMSGITIKGSYDASFVREGRLYIDDLKYGWGLVEAKNNWQLLGYGIGEVIRRQQRFDEIVLRIHQPRPHHEEGTTRQWVLTYEELLKWKEVIELRMEEIAAGMQDLITGEHCRYCPAAASCPAHNKSYFRGVETVHSFLQDDLSDEELSFQLDLFNRISDVFKTRKSSLEQLAVDRLKNGRLIPNYVSSESYGNRVWKSNISADAIKMMTGKTVTKTEMLSPAQAEKVGIDKKFIAGLSDRKFLGQKLKKCDTSKLGDKIFGKPNGS